MSCCDTKTLLSEVNTWQLERLKITYQAAILAAIVEEWTSRKAADFYKLNWADLHIRIKIFRQHKVMEIAIEPNELSLQSLDILKRCSPTFIDENDDSDYIFNQEIFLKYQGAQSDLCKAAIKVLKYYTIDLDIIQLFYGICNESWNHQMETIEYEISDAEETCQLERNLFKCNKIIQQSFLEQIATKPEYLEERCQMDCHDCFLTALPTLVDEYVIKKNIVMPDKWTIDEKVHKSWIEKFLIIHDAKIKELFSSTHIKQTSTS